MLRYTTRHCGGPRGSRTRTPEGHRDLNPARLPVTPGGRTGRCRRTARSGRWASNPRHSPWNSELAARACRRRQGFMPVSVGRSACALRWERTVPGAWRHPAIRPRHRNRVNVHVWLAGHLLPGEPGRRGGRSPISLGDGASHTLEFSRVCASPRGTGCRVLMPRTAASDSVSDGENGATRKTSCPGHFQPSYVVVLRIWVQLATATSSDVSARDNSQAERFMRLFFGPLLPAGAHAH